MSAARSRSQRDLDAAYMAPRVGRTALLCLSCERTYARGGHEADCPDRSVVLRRIGESEADALARAEGVTP